MKKWIARLFGGSAGDDPVPASTPAAAPAQPALPGEASSARHFDEVNVAFCRWLAGPAAVSAAPAAAEALILDELARLARAPQAAAELVPRVPAVIPQLLRSLRDESQSGADLSRQVAQDVVLVAEVIREANSPYYRPSTPVRTIEGAVMLLGQNGLRMLLARVAFRPIISMQSGRFARLVAPQLWSQSEKCALAANLLAPGMDANPFEAYLAGLMQNVGLVVAFRLIDQVYHDEALPQSEAFCAALLANARTLSAGIAAEWDFPGTVSHAIAQAGAPGAPPLAQALALGDQLAKLRVLVDAGVYAADDPFVTRRLDASLRKCFDKLRSEED
jgi:HD-like signal output (HDOD) protein